MPEINFSLIGHVLHHTLPAPREKISGTFFDSTVVTVDLMANISRRYTLYLRPTDYVTQLL